MINRNLIFSVLMSVLAALSFDISAQNTDTYFPYPTPPDSLKTLNQRCDYLVTHFWDHCDLKKAFSSRPKMRQALADYLSFMPYATADVVYESIGKFMKKIEKQPEDQLFVVDEVEAQLTGDSCQYYSEQAYLPFARSLVANKRVDKTSKLRYQHQVQLLGTTQPGMIAPELAYTDRFGNPGSLASDSSQVIILYFSDPDCSDCRMARVQLDANIQASRLIDRGVVKVICITPDDYSEEWAQAVAKYPEKWTVTASPDADMIYHIKTYPSFYILDSQHKIHAKNYGIDEILEVLARLDERTQK